VIKLYTRVMVIGDISDITNILNVDIVNRCTNAITITRCEPTLADQFVYVLDACAKAMGKKLQAEKITRKVLLDYKFVSGGHGMYDEVFIVVIDKDRQLHANDKLGSSVLFDSKMH